MKEFKIVYITLIIFFIYLFIISSVNPTYGFNIDINSDSYEVNEPISMKIATHKNGSNYSFDQLTIQITHTYDKLLSEEIIIEPYLEGEYYYVFIPPITNNYIITFIGEVDGEIISKTKELNIQ